MPLESSAVEHYAEQLEAAETSRTQIGHISRQHPDMSISDGYAIQRAWMKRKLAAGRRPIGHKIGLTSRAMQRAVNITEPDYGLLLDDMLYQDGQELPMERFIEPRVEVELAFILARPLRGEGVTLFDVLNATDYILPAAEIIDARIQRIDPETKATRKVFDTISDNAANAAIVIGGRPVRPDALDLRNVSAVLRRDHVIEETGVAAAVLNHPANGVAWLARRLAPYGEGLEPGEIVLSGSFTGPVFASQGQVFTIEYSGLGTMAFRFA